MADEAQPVNLVIFGRQGSGKGTQCGRLVARYGCVHVSTGDMLRSAVEAETELGIQAKEIMDSGGLVSDDIMIGLVAERLAAEDIAAGGFLLDGFPRTPAQADALSDIVSSLGTQIVAGINLDVPVEEVTARMLERAREDDTEAAISRRLSLYEEETAPLIEWFDAQGLLSVVDGLGTEDEVADRLAAVIEARLAAVRDTHEAEDAQGEDDINT